MDKSVETKEHYKKSTVFGMVQRNCEVRAIHVDNSEAISLLPVI